MAWVEWLFLNHQNLIHIPVAVAILLPFALMAAQRPGRGIRPWWVTCRYLTWAAFLVSIFVAWTGVKQTLHLGLPFTTWARTLAKDPLALHQTLGLCTLLLGLATALSISRKRDEHKGLGILTLLLGLLWSASILAGTYFAFQWKQTQKTPAHPSGVFYSVSTAPE